MKLFSEILKKYKFLLLFIIIFLEILCFIPLLISYKPIFSKVFEQTIEISKKKTQSITSTLNEILKYSINMHLQDLKLIGKHMSFLINDKINNNSKYYKNIMNSNDKIIYNATLEELKSKFNNYYNEELNKFCYLDKYINDIIENKGNLTKIINDLMNPKIHPELNSISYYNYNGKIEDDMKIIKSKYLISALKTNLIKRILIKGKEFELTHYYLFNKDELYIYPPEAFNNTDINIHIIADIVECDQNFIECFHKLTKKHMMSISEGVDTIGYIYPSIPLSLIKYQNIINILCLNIPFENELDLKDLSINPILCKGINMSKLFSEPLFKEKGYFNFIFFVQIYNDIIPIYYNKIDLYEEIKIIFRDPKFKELSIKEEAFQHFKLFHFLYINLFKEPSLLKNNNISFNDIINEYYSIKNQILEGISKFNITNEEYFELNIQKTTCKSHIYNNDKICLKDNFLLIIYPLKYYYNLIDENYIENTNKSINQLVFYSMSIISNNYDYLEWKINRVVLIKIMKLFFLYFTTSSCLLLLIFIFIRIFFINKYNIINQILFIIKGDSFFEINDKDETIINNKDILVKPNNKEMLALKKLFDYFLKIMRLKFNFEQKENNLYKKISKKERKTQITINDLKVNKKNIDTLNEYKELIDNINNGEIQIMLSFIISYNHFKKGLYKISENEFRNLIIEMNSYQNKIYNENEYKNSKLKDTISRCSKISYLNEYSLTNELSEEILPIIKIKLMAQKIYYLYALNIFNQEKMKENNDKKYNKENAKKRYEEAIKYFIESKNISILLGLDIIRQIFTLLLISECYTELKNYKESMININEALLLFSDLQKIFMDKPYFNPNIMIFIENYIFQSIMLSMAQTTFIFNKYPQSCWILMKMIETSPFVFNIIHLRASFLLSNCLSQIESLNILPFRQIDKYKKKINKMFARINIKLYNEEKKANIDSNNNNNNSNDNILSFPSNKINQTNNLNISLENIWNTGNFKKLLKNKDMVTNKMSITKSSLNISQKNKYKNINLCISERVLQEINGNELKDIIIKFFKKSFCNGMEEDKFSFIQFSFNGKKTLAIKSDSLDIILQKIETNRMAFKINDALIKNNFQIQFMEFSNLLLSIVKSQKQLNYEDKNDNIIIIFINTSDIRFNSQKECVDTINELNNNNYSVFIFTYDNEIDEDKIEGIYSFIYGLNEGHFFQIKNYQQVKQIFMNFCVKDSQEKFNNYYYEITDYMF